MAKKADHDQIHTNILIYVIWNKSQATEKVTETLCFLYTVTDRIKACVG